MPDGPFPPASKRLRGRRNWSLRRSRRTRGPVSCKYPLDIPAGRRVLMIMPPAVDPQTLLRPDLQPEILQLRLILIVLPPFDGTPLQLGRAPCRARACHSV